MRGGSRRLGSCKFKNLQPITQSNVYGIRTHVGPEPLAPELARTTVHRNSGQSDPTNGLVLLSA